MLETMPTCKIEILLPVTMQNEYLIKQSHIGSYNSKLSCIISIGICISENLPLSRYHYHLGFKTLTF